MVKQEKPNLSLRWRGRIPLTSTLAASIGLLVLVTVGIVFGVSVWLAQKNTFDLLRSIANQAVSANVNEIEQHLRPVEHQLRFLSDQIANGEFEPANNELIRTLLSGALAGTRQVESIMFVDNDLQGVVARRVGRNNTVKVRDIDQSQELIVKESVAKKILTMRWSPPIWLDPQANTYLKAIQPIRRNGEFIGLVVAQTSVQGLSTFISDSGLDNGGNRFVLYGQNHVLAHWLLEGRHPERSISQPLPPVSTFGDPVLASIWQERIRDDLALDTPEQIEAHMVNLFNTKYAFVYQRVHGYGELPLIVGAYFQANNSVKEIRRMFAALVTGLAVLVLSLLAAIWLGRRIARPIVQFSAATGQIRNLDLSNIEELPGSVVRELNDQSVAFNAMLGALRWFELYVPKNVVQRLIRRGEVGDLISDDREITVIFTDIAEFSTMSEGMSASEVAIFLNHHFSLVTDCIERENGTIDKFMGDAVMAFWGAVEQDSQNNGADGACRAAQAIAASVKQDNVTRKASGLPPIGIRIGIHTGKATIGNIGASGRLNYTIIGDAVNIGQRVEQLGKQVYPRGTEVSILISGDTQRRVGSSFPLESIGHRTLKGRSGAIEVFKLN